MTSCLDITPSAPLKLIHIASKSFQRGKRTVVFHGFQSLKMFQNSMATLGADSSTLSLEGFHARTSAHPEKAQESKASGLECGFTWHESSVKFDPVTRSWKTRQCSLLAGLDEFSETWPKWGMMRDGECWELPKLERNTKENESGLLPTPTKHNSKEGAHPSEYNRNTPTLATHAGGKINPEWTEWLMGWPIKWTDLQPSETDKFRQWQHSHGISFQKTP